MSQMVIPPPRPGYQRQWVKCNECGRKAYYDYVPRSLSNPVRTLPCGHGIALAWRDAVTYIEPPAIVSYTMEIDR